MPASLPRAAWAIVVALFTVAWFAALDVRKLQHPDEGRYAEIAREMAVSGDWLTPRLNGGKYFEKPPLQFWLTAASYRLFETDQWTARLVPAVAGFLTIVVVGFAGAALAGAMAGTYAAIALAACVWHVGLSHFATLDALLGFLLTASLGSFLLANRAGLAPSRVRRWMMVAWAGIALATLTKGLVALVIPGATLVLYALVTRDGGPLRRLHALPGIAIFAAIAVPWFVLVSIANPGFAEFYFVREHLDRFLTTGHNRTGAWWYFVPLFAAGLLPWLTVAPWTWRASWRAAATDNGFRWQAFCLVWAAFVFAFFSASGSKLPSYILPMFPALALPLGLALATLPGRRLATLLAPVPVVAVMLLAAAVLGYDRLAVRFGDAQTPSTLYQAYRPWVLLASAVTVVATVTAWAMLRRDGGRLKTAALATLAFGTVATFQVLFVGVDVFRVTRSGYDILRAAGIAQGAPLDRKVPFYQVGSYDQTVPFYLDRVTTVVAFRDELAMGLDMEPALDVPTEWEWRDLWRKLPAGYALMTRTDHERLAAYGLPMRVLATDPRRVLVSRH